MSLSLHLIESFVLFAETGNLSETARLLGQTQPSASRQMEQFEKHFPRNLFVRAGKQKKLTPYGEEVFAYYRDSIKQLRQLKSEFSPGAQILTLAARSEILQTYITPLNFKNPLELLPLSGSQIRDGLTKGRFDMAVLQENFESYEYFRKKLFTTGWKLIYPKSWKSISSVAHWLENNLALPFAAYDRNLNYLTESKFKKIPATDLNIQMVAADWRILEDKVKRQQCWAIVPEEYGRHEKVVSLSLQDYIKDTPFYVYFRRELSKNKEVQQLISQLS